MDSKDRTMELQGSVWLTVDGEKFGGEQRIALLAKIAECGSITQAAKAIKMSYKAAWDAIDAMSNLAGEPLMQRAAGGKGGGGLGFAQIDAQAGVFFGNVNKGDVAFPVGRALIFHPDDGRKNVPDNLKPGPFRHSVKIAGAGVPGEETEV